MVGKGLRATQRGRRRIETAGKSDRRMRLLHRHLEWSFDRGMVSTRVPSTLCTEKSLGVSQVALQAPSDLPRCNLTVDSHCALCEVINMTISAMIAASSCRGLLRD